MRVIRALMVGIAAALLAIAISTNGARVAAGAGDGGHERAQASSPDAGSGSFLNFESGHVRPLAIAPDGRRLFAVNTHDARLAVFDIHENGLSNVAEIPVGLEPIAVAARRNRRGHSEVWVVNHLSDSVSVVEINDSDPGSSRVTRTLLVGDEPSDIVFAGPGRERAFITSARRGQNAPLDPLLTTPGVPRALVWVFDTEALPSGLTQPPLSILELFADTPRALAVSADGSTVYAAAFQSGNQTTAIAQPVLSRFGALPAPPSGSTPNSPTTALIVQYDKRTNKWVDESGRDLSKMIQFRLPDYDVFVIDAAASPPTMRSAVPGVGTILFSMAVRPGTGSLHVANLDLRNHVRFEPALNGHIADNRVTIVDGAGGVRPVNLNPHIQYDGRRGDPATIERSIGLPVHLAFSPDGQTLYVAALGSGGIAAIDAHALEQGHPQPRLAHTGGGPSGIAIDGQGKWLYVMRSFDNAISVMDARLLTERARAPVGHDPAPPAVRKGRQFLYDTRLSAFGDQACATCHIFGDVDGLAWDLGDPRGKKEPNSNEYRLPGPLPPFFHPMKGPMSTQSLRGMAGNGPMHWRGDRSTAGESGTTRSDEIGAFKKFNPAFKSLLGSVQELPAADMHAFAEFALTLRYPPNPVRALDDSLTPVQAAGEGIFTTKAPIDPTRGACTTCHELPAGTSGKMAFDAEPQDFKIPHLRNLYQKVGMFGFSPGTFFPAHLATGDQVRGFGFLHDGSFDTMYTFLHSPILFFGRPPDPEADAERRAVEAYLLAFDTGLKPAVGQQLTLGQSNAGNPAVAAHLSLLLNRANEKDCDLIVRGIDDGTPRSWLHRQGAFAPDRRHASNRDLRAMLDGAAKPGQEMTFTCVPPGTGHRMALDRDEDGHLDGDEAETARAQPIRR